MAKLDDLIQQKQQRDEDWKAKKTNDIQREISPQERKQPEQNRPVR